MTRELTIGYSPCPNDTFIFSALIHGHARIPGVAFKEIIEDVERLNQLAHTGSLAITKASYHAAGHLRETYALLRSGGALGRGCGPLIVARPGTTLKDLQSGPIAVPGKLTTAYLLLRIFNPEIKNTVFMSYDRIMHAVATGSVSAGLIIHESRFTYPGQGLIKLLDLGEWWETYTSMPIPLGGILAKRSLGRDLLLQIEHAIAGSLRYARTHLQDTMPYCRKYAQELQPDVLKQHIDLYVNDFSLDLGVDGLAAVHRLFAEAEKRGIFPHSDRPLLAEEA